MSFFLDSGVGGGSESGGRGLGIVGEGGWGRGTRVNSSAFSGPYAKTATGSRFFYPCIELFSSRLFLRVLCTNHVYVDFAKGLR